MSTIILFTRFYSLNDNIINKKKKEIDKIRNEMLINGREKEKRAHKLLWDFIEHNIQRWWD